MPKENVNSSSNVLNNTILPLEEDLEAEKNFSLTASELSTQAGQKTTKPLPPVPSEEVSEKSKQKRSAITQNEAETIVIDPKDIVGLNSNSSIVITGEVSTKNEIEPPVIDQVSRSAEPDKVPEKSKPKTVKPSPKIPRENSTSFNNPFPRDSDLLVENFLKKASDPQNVSSNSKKTQEQFEDVQLNEPMNDKKLKQKQKSLLDELKKAYEDEPNKRIKALRSECIEEIKALRKEPELTTDQDRENHFSKEEKIKEKYDELVEKTQDIISDKGISGKFKTGIKNLPNYFNPKDYGERTESAKEIAQDTAKTIGKAGLIAAGFVPGPIGIAAGVVNGLRVASNAADKIFGEKPGTLGKIAKYTMMAGTAIVFGAAGSVGAAGALGLVAAGANAIVKSNEAAENKLIREERDRIFNSDELEQTKDQSKGKDKDKQKDTRSNETSKEKSNSEEKTTSSEKKSSTLKKVGKIALTGLAVAGTVALGVVTGGIGLAAGAAIIGIGTAIAKIVESRKNPKKEETTEIPYSSGNNTKSKEQDQIGKVEISPPTLTPKPHLSAENPGKKGHSI